MGDAIKTEVIIKLYRQIDTLSRRRTCINIVGWCKIPSDCQENWSWEKEHHNDFVLSTCVFNVCLIHCLSEEGLVSEGPVNNQTVKQLLPLDQNKAKSWNIVLQCRSVGRSVGEIHLSPPSSTPLHYPTHTPQSTSWALLCALLTHSPDAFNSDQFSHDLFLQLLLQSLLSWVVDVICFHK